MGRHGDAWKVRVTEAPERGRANEAVLRLLAETLALPRTALTLVSGHGGREKVVSIEPFPGQSHEKRAPGQRAGIGRDDVEGRPVGATRNLQRLMNRALGPGEGHATSRATMSRSSKGCFTVPMTW